VKANRAAWIALLLVSMTQAMSMIDRQILAILVPRIQADLQVGSAEMGLLYGTVFGLFYALFSLPLGRLADGWIRTKLLSLSILGWSVMTGLAGFANSFMMLAITRLGVGIGEASTQPAGASLLSDHFPKERRGLLSAAIAAAISVGLGGALILGGLTADWWDGTFTASTAPLGLKGWQAAFIAASIPGLVLSIFLWRMEEPVRGAMDGIVQAPDPAPFRASWGTLSAVLPGFNFLSLYRGKATGAMWLANLLGLAAIILSAIALTNWSNGLRTTNVPALVVGDIALGGNALQWSVTGFGIYIILNWLQSLKLHDKPAYAVIAKTPALFLVLAINGLQSIINYGVMFGSPTFIGKTFALKPSEFVLQFGFLMTALGIVGPLIAGPLSDFIHRRVPGGRVYVTLVALTLSPFLAFKTYGAATVGEFYLWFTFYSLFLTMWLPPIYACLLDLVLPRMRGMIMSLYILTSTLMGLGLGPYTVGMVSDINGGHIGPAILSLYWLGVPIVILIAMLIRQLPKDDARVVERARAAGEPVEATE
jgi:MFS transporter, Spinster family, sphingosine-1-phosphate transporter